MKRLNPLRHLADELEALAREGLLRDACPDPVAPGALSFCSNDYLGFAGRTPPPAPSGAGASRLVAGERIEHRKLEEALAAWLGAEAVLLFSSGYAANVGVLSALASREDLVVSDALNHASLIDGARLSRARTAVVPHLDVDAVGAALAAGGYRRAWVVVESYYSMDADGPDLAALRDACDRHGAALIVDEAHALGVLGPEGRGRSAQASIAPDVLIGTLGKAFGAQGAFVAGSDLLRTWLWNRARSFVYSTGLAPSSAAAAATALSALRAETSDASRLLDLAERLRAELRRRGAPVIGFGHIVPVVVGEARRAVRLASELRTRGVLVHAVRPPTVPAGTSRIRFTVTARHTAADVERAVDAYADATEALASACFT